MITVKDVWGGYEFRGMSNEVKPTKNVFNGSIYREIDTGTCYMFDGENEQWHEVTIGGGGGGKVADAYLKKIEKDEVNKEITISDDLGIETKFNYGGGDIGEVTYFEFNFTDGTTKNYKLINED